MDIAIEAANLTRVYPGGVRAVDDMNFSVRRGEIFGLLGVNGAGKTTLIKVLTTLLRPSSGKVRVLGYDVTGDPVKVKRRIGVVPQENNIDTRLTVRQNLTFHCRYFGLEKRAYTREIDAWIEILGLKDKEGEFVFHLSGGTKRKVMLAKAFITRPELIIMDEPTSGLDPEVRAVVWEKITDFKRSGGTVFLSTHYLEEAERLADRIGIIHNGRLVAMDDTAELKRRAMDSTLPGKAGIEEMFRLALGGLL